MDRKRLMVVAGVSGAIFAASVALFAWQLSVSADRGGVSPEPRIEVLTCKAAIKSGDAITNLSVVSKSVPKSLVPDGAVLASEFSKINGQRVGASMARGEILTNERLSKAASPLDQTRPGHTAVTVAVDTVRALGGEATPGMRVDLMVEQSIGTISLIAEDVQILSTSVREAPESESSIMAPASTPSADITWVTLEVPNESTSAVVAASAAGSVYLVFPASDMASSRG